MDVVRPLRGEPADSVPEDAVNVYYDRRFLTKDQLVLRTVNLKARVTTDSNVAMLAEPSTILLLTMFYLANESWLGCITEDLHKGRQGTLRSTYMSDDNGEISRIQVYKTDVYDENDLLTGWVFSFANEDPEFSWALAVHNHLENNRLARQRSFVPWQQFVLMIKDQRDWVNRVLLPCCPEKVSYGPNAEAVRARGLLTELCNPLNPFCVTTLFDPAYVHLRAPQLKQAPLLRITKLDVLFTDPAFVYNAHMSVDGVSEDWANRYTPEEKALLEQMAPIESTTEDEHILSSVMKMNAAELVGLTGEAKRQKRASSEFKERLRRTLMSEQDPGPLLLSKWIAENQDFEKNPYHPTQIQMDPTLSFFANNVISKMYIYENVFKMFAMHEIMLFAELSRFCINFYQNSMYLHILVTGGAGSGKSFMLDLIKEITPNGVVEHKTYGSKRAMNTGGFTNGIVHAYDEAKFLFDQGDESGQGDEQTKEIMTRNKCVSEINEEDPLTGKRVTVKKVTDAKNQYLMLTNKAKYMLPPPNRSRVYTIPAPNYTRKDVDTTLIGMNDAEKALYQKHLTTCHQEFYIFFRIARAMDCGLIPYPNIDVAVRLYAMCFSFMRDEGLVIDKRDVERLEMFTRSVTIWNAIRTHYWSGVPEDPQPLGNFDALVPLMIADEEIAIFCLTALRHTFEDENDIRVCQSVKANADASSMPFPERVSGSSELTDYDYYFVSCSTNGDNAGKIASACKTIFRSCPKSSFAAISEVSIHDVLDGFMSKKFLSPRYTGKHESDRAGEQTELRPVLTFTTRNGMHGVGVLRSYVQSMCSGNRHVVLRAIDSCMDSQTIHTRVITAMSYRDGVTVDLNGHKEGVMVQPKGHPGDTTVVPKVEPPMYRMFPHILQCYTMVPKKQVPCLIRNRNSRQHGYYTAVLNEPEPTSTEKTFIQFEGDYFEYVRDQYLEEEGHPMVEPRVVLATEDTANEELKLLVKPNHHYPDQCIIEHCRYFDQREVGRIERTPEGVYKMNGNLQRGKRKSDSSQLVLDAKRVCREDDGV